jgi:Tfp pilus assembly protein PilF
MSKISQQLAVAIRHQQAGRLQAAEEICRQILAAEPKHVDAIHLLGVIGQQIGRLDDAIDHYRRALQAGPDFAEAHFNLGLALKQHHQPDEAIASYRRAIELRPDFAEAHNNLGNALRELGELDEAVARCRRAIELKPDYAEAHNNLGVALSELGKPDEAIVCWRRAIELRPDFAAAHGNLAAALKDQGKLDEAIVCFRRVAELAPSSADSHSPLGSALAEAGDLAGAIDAFRTALELQPQFAFAHLKLAELQGGNVSDDELTLLRRLLEQLDLNGAQRLLLHFALARVLDVRGEYSEAAEHIDRGNALASAERRKSGQAYDPSEFQSLVTRMISVTSPEFFERTRGFGLQSELPVFVVGLPRSGTTLVEQILASHSQVFAAGEIDLVEDTAAELACGAAVPAASKAQAGRLNDVAGALEFIDRLCDHDRQTAGLLAARHLENLRHFHSAALRIVDKTPENYYYLGLLACLFPRAKVIHCRRDLRDVALSCWMTHFRDLRWANDQRHIAMRVCDYGRLTAHWRKVLPLPMLEVRYERMVADLENSARAIVAWCGLEWEPACLDFHKAKRRVATASLVQVRQPVFTTSVGRWKHYRDVLAPLFSMLQGVRS